MTLAEIDEKLRGLRMVEDAELIAFYQEQKQEILNKIYNIKKEDKNNGSN